MIQFSRREVLQQALDLIWRKKFLWWLGFFAGLATYNGQADFLFKNINAVDSMQQYLVAVRDVVKSGQADSFFHLIRDFFVSQPAIAFSYLFLIILIALIILWLIIVSQAALVRIVGRSVEKKTSGIFDGLAVAGERFWPLFTINVIAKLFTWGLWVLLAGIPAIIYYLNGTFAWAVTMSIGWFLISVPLSIVISFLILYSSAYIILQGLPPLPAIRQAWKLFKDNWLVTLEIAGLIYLFNIVVSFIVTAVAFYTIQPYSWTGLGLLLFVLALELSFLSAFSYTAWTIVFQKLQTGRPESKIGQWTTRLVNLASPKRIPD